MLRAVTRTRPEHTLAVAGLAARASTAKARVPAALTELDVHGYLAQLVRIAPHLSAALPPPTPSTLAGTPTIDPADPETA